jgi:hypothetical protein
MASKFFFYSIIFLTGIFFLLFSGAKAHQTGSSWEKVVGNYKIDLGYDPTVVLSGQPERLDFNIIDTKTGQSAPFTDVWVRISQDQDTVFASGIHRLTFGLTGMIFEFPKSGDFNLNVRFENQDNTIVQADFPITVAGQDIAVKPAAKYPIILITVVGMFGLIAGSLVPLALGKK